MDAPVRVAAIDCGTNSLRLLVADVDLDDAGRARLVDVDRRLEVVRLGEGVDAAGAFLPAALERTLATTARYAALVRSLGAERVRFVATSATRDASNARELVDGVRELLGVEPEVIPGEEEARLSFAGAVADLGSRRAPYLVVDLGGGSTELVLGDSAGGGGVVLAARSVDVGCVRLTERHLHADPPTPSQVASARADAAAAVALAAQVVPLAGVATLVGVAGTVTTVTAHALRLDRYDTSRLHGAVVGVEQVLAACDELLAMPRAARAALPFMHPGRVEVIGGGALLWREVVAATAGASGIEEVVTSEHDILDGMAFALASAGSRCATDPTMIMG